MEKIEIEEEEVRDPIPGEYGHPIPRELLFRELGFTQPYSRHQVGRRVVSTTLATKAVHTLCTKETVNRRKFKLPAGARTTFHMAFSADGTKLASCHGDHNVYVCDVRNGEILQTLSGHPRTPWCVVFHPTQNDVLASGCLAGHVRVWDLKGGSEVLVTDSGTVIASLAFHPTVRLLAIATFNEIIFWDWGLPHPLARCSTENTKEKVRLVRFDRLGKCLITGITNFPTPPVREGLQTSNSGANHRPNILSRGNPRLPSYRYLVHDRQDIGDNREGPTGIGDIQENRNAEAHPHRDMAEFAESFAAAAEAEAASMVLNRRQDRFQESYRQLVSHYQDLVSHYQQFLRSRIPRLLETSRSVREQPIIPVQNPVVLLSSETPSSSGQSSRAQVQVQSSESANSSSVGNEQPGTSRLMQLEARLLEIINTPENSDASQGPSTPASTTTTTTTTATTAAATAATTTATVNATAGPSNSSIPSRLRNDTDLRNIEVLAQNILEMQNLCSQARRDAPVTHIETQHIIELQNIRSHLELLQEQTRELQSSIRATLTSLARGSLDALRTHVTNASNGAAFSNFSRGTLDSIRSHAENNGSVHAGFFSIPSATSQPSSGGTNQGAPRSFSSPASNQQNSSGNPSNAILRITIGPRLTASAELIPPVGPGTAPSSISSGGATRTQVPPAISMQYETTGGGLRGSSAGDTESTEPLASTSRGTGRGSNDPNIGYLGQRRILREFQFVAGRGSNNEMEQHARNCPFGGRDQSQRPPPRMRCLSEMGETPTLTVWPTIETGLELETRNFREVREPRGRIESRSSTTSSSNSNTTNNNSSSNHNNNNNSISEPRVASEPSVANPAAVNFSSPLSAAQLAGNYFNQWYAGGPGWISSDVGVHVFLTTHRGSSETVRRNALPSSSTTTTTTTAELSDGADGENWQRIFPHGFAFIHPSARQGHRPDRRSYRRDPRRPGPYGPARNRQEGYGNNYSRDSNNVWSEMGRSVPNLQSLPSTSSSHLSSTQGTSSSSTSGGGGTASAAASSRNSGRPLPQRLNGNFGLIYYMRAGDEIIPVYAPRSTEFADANEPVALREGPLPNVYVFPIGLFLRGSYWRNGTQTIGIYWPPASRDEEQALSDYRRNDSLVPIHTTSVRQISAIQRSESFNNARYRVAYNSDQTEIFFPQGGSLVLIQPGLLVLDSVTSFADFDRPRADGGTLYLDHLSTFFEALESLFGFRQRNAALSGGGGGGGNSNSSNSSRSSSQGNWGRHAGIPQQWLENSPFAQGPRIYYDAPDRPDVNGLLSRRNPSDVSFIPMIPAEARVTLERIDRPTIERARRGGMRDEDSTSRPPANSNTTAHTITTSSTGSEGNPTPRAERWGGSGGGRAAQENSNQNDQGNDAMSATRRVIRLAVDTATADILRRDQQTARGHITRAIESRIERVLNERGNRGVPESVPHSVMYLPMASVNVYNNPDYLERQLRLEDIQLRISMLSPWSQQQNRQPSESVTSATQTTASYLQNAPAANPEQTSAASPTATTTTTAAGNPVSEPTPSTSTGGPTSVDPSLRASRRRPFPSPPESQSSAGSVTTPVTSSSYFDDESFPSPSRIPRLTSPLPAHFTHDRPTDPRRVDDRSTNRDWTRGPMDRSGSSSSSGRVSDRRSNDPFSENNNAPVPEFSAARPTNPLLQTMESGTSGDSSSSPPPPVNVSLGRTSSYLPAESPEEALRGSLTLTEEERASDLNEFWRNSSRYERSITQEEREPLRERAPGDFEPSFRGLINSADEFAPVDQPAEPLTLRLRDVLTPVEVSRIEGARRSVIPRVDLDSPDSDDVEVEREAHLVVGAAVPFESSDVLEAAGWGHEGRRGDGPYGGEPIDVNRVGNPVLQRVGEDTARAAIAAMEMMRRESVVPRDDSVAGVEERSFYESEPSGLAGSFPVVGSPGDNLQRQQRRVGSSVPDVSTEVERELSSRERRRGRPLSRMGGSGPSILRTVDEATARNALSASFDLPSAGSATTTMQPSMDSPSTSAATNLSEDNGSSPSGSLSSSQRHGQQPPRSRPPMCTQFGEWFLRRQQRSASQYRVRLRNGDPSYHGGSSSSSSSGSQELSGSARTRLGLGGGTGVSSARYSSGSGRGGNSGGSSGGGGGSNRQNSNSAYGVPQYSMYRNAHHFHIHHAMAGNPTNNGDDPGTQQDSGVRFYPGYIPEILITPRTRAQTYYTMDAATTAFLSSRIQKWDFSEFYIPDITDRTSGLITASCSLHSDATLDVSSDSEFIAVLQPSDNGSYSAVGIYSLRDETLGASLYTYHFDQNTVSVSISPSCDYIVVGYAGRGPFYRIVHPSRNIGQILSLTRDREHVKLVPVKELLADTQPTLMSINCMHWVPIPGYGIIYGTNTGEVVLLS